MLRNKSQAQFIIIFIFFTPISVLFSLSKDIQQQLTSTELKKLKNSNPITIGITTIPPQIIPTKNGTYEGIAIDYINLLEKKLGIQFKIV